MRKKLYQVVKAVLILCWIVVVLGACARQVVTLEGDVVPLRRAFEMQIEGVHYPVYEFEHDGLRCLVAYGSYLSGLWCERVDE